MIHHASITAGENFNYRTRKQVQYILYKLKIGTHIICVHKGTSGGSWGKSEAVARRHQIEAGKGWEAAHTPSYEEASDKPSTQQHTSGDIPCYTRRDGR
jgi:hypothetical protein